MIGSRRNTSPIDIIIPCFRGFVETRRTIESVLNAATAIPHHLVVIDDASAEPAISDYLSRLPPTVELIRHAENRGFVASVNEGMQLHEDRDVLLLNSDTAVADGWLDRLVAHAEAHSRVASITPLSNNGSIASYPSIVERNEIDADRASTIDAMAARVNAGRSVRAPVGVGFCLWIAREALKEIGYFDEAQFGKGYGEEVEWCLRAGERGFHHLIAADVFVFHAGETSFGASSGARRERAQALIDTVFPAFSPDVQAFLSVDPVYELRRRLTLACDFAGALGDDRQTVLHVNTLNAGGVDRFIRDAASGVASVRHALMHVGEHCTLVESLGSGYVIQLGDLGEQAGLLLRALRVGVLHVHSTAAGVESAVAALLRAAPDLRYVLTLHDVLFVNEQAFNAEVISPHESTLARTTKMMARAIAITAPSEYVAQLSREHVGIDPILLPNARPISASPEADTKSAAPPPASFRQVVTDQAVFAVIGAIGPHKGSNVLKSIVATLPSDIVCVVIGYTDTQTAPGWMDDRIYIHGPYLPADLSPLLQAYRARLAFFPNRVPESFSYVLSEVWQAGLPALVPSTGALAERVRRWGGGEVFDHAAPPGVIAVQIEKMARSPPLHAPPNSPPAIPDFATMTLTLDYLYQKHPDEQCWALNAEESVAAVEQFVKVNLDGTEFRKELIRVIASNAQLRKSLTEHQAWQAHLEGDVAALNESILALRGSCQQLENDIAGLKSQMAADAQRYRVVRAVFDRLPRFAQRTINAWGIGAR
jgi:O-antigen biosynthesis protein